jgi:hypothetical protein
VPFNITTTSFFGHYFTILFILWHSTLLQYPSNFWIVQNKQNSEVVAKKRCCSNVEWYRINKIVKQWPKKDVVVMLNATLLQYLYLVTTSLFCLFCTIQHYYNTFFWPQRHYFVYTVRVF